MTRATVVKRVGAIIRLLATGLLLIPVSSSLAYDFSPVDLHPFLFVLWIVAVSVGLWWLAVKVRDVASSDGHFRFSLKAFLFVVFLLCILLATAGSRLHDIGRQSVALIKIRAAGGQISGHNSDPKLNLDLLNSIGFDPWERYTSIDVDDDAALAGLCRNPAAFRHLQQLSIDEHVTDVGMAHLSKNRFPQLNQVSCYGNAITSSGLKQLAELQRVDSVWLNRCYAICDDGFRGFEHLRYLGVLGDGEGPKKRMRLTDKSMHCIGNMTKLESLWLTGAPGVTDKGLLKLADCKSLTDLLLRNTSVTDDGVKRLQELLPNCRIRNLGRVPDNH